jgi:cytochrome b561
MPRRVDVTLAVSPGWGKAQRRLHWWSAALVLLGFTVAWPMVAVPLRDLLVKFLLYQLHKTVGLLVLLLTALRVPVRLWRGRPAWDSDLPAWQRHAAAWGHLGLYALLLAVPALGYFTAATAPAGVPTLFFLVIPVPHLVGVDPAAFAVLRPVHRILAILLVALAGGHALAAIFHHRHGRHTLVAMWRGDARPSAASPPTPL